MAHLPRADARHPCHSCRLYTAEGTAKPSPAIHRRTLPLPNRRRRAPSRHPVFGLRRKRTLTYARFEPINGYVTTLYAESAPIHLPETPNELAAVPTP